MQRHLRLRGRDDFAALRASGQVCHHRLCVLSYRPNGLPHNRYGFIVVKRLGKAVVRNRIRRQMREAVRLRHPLVAAHIDQGFDLAFIARDPIRQAGFHDIAAAVDNVLRCAGLLPDDTPPIHPDGQSRGHPTP